MHRTIIDVIFFLILWVFKKQINTRLSVRLHFGFINKKFIFFFP